MKLSTQISGLAGRFGDEEAIRRLAAAGYDSLDFSLFQMSRDDSRGDIGGVFCANSGQCWGSRRDFLCGVFVTIHRICVLGNASVEILHILFVRDSWPTNLSTYAHREKT